MRSPTSSTRPGPKIEEARVMSRCANSSLARLDFSRSRALRKLVAGASGTFPRFCCSESRNGRPSRGTGLAHVFEERNSVAPEHRILEAALVKGRGQLDLSTAKGEKLTAAADDHLGPRVGSEYSTRYIFYLEPGTGPDSHGSMAGTSRPSRPSRRAGITKPPVYLDAKATTSARPWPSVLTSPAPRDRIPRPGWFGQKAPRSWNWRRRSTRAGFPRLVFCAPDCFRRRQRLRRDGSWKMRYDIGNGFTQRSAAACAKSADSRPDARWWC